MSCTVRAASCDFGGWPLRGNTFYASGPFGPFNVSG